MNPKNFIVSFKFKKIKNKNAVSNKNVYLLGFLHILKTLVSGLGGGNTGRKYSCLHLKALVHPCFLKYFLA